MALMLEKTESQKMPTHAERLCGPGDRKHDFQQIHSPFGLENKKFSNDRFIGNRMTATEIKDKQGI